MTETEQEKVQEAISQHLAKTQKLITELQELTQPIAPENAIGRVSRMDAINNRSVNESALRKAQQKLIKLKHSQERLAKGELENCTNCKNPIRLERLIYMPESNLCTACARRM